MRRVRIAQIGTSRYSHGGEIFDTLTRHPEAFEVVGYALPEGERERFPEKMDSFLGYTEMTVDEILSDPSIEAVTIETEEIYLTKYALMAAERGKHIHMEKPGGEVLYDFVRLIDTVKASGTVLHIGYMYRYNHAVKELIARAGAGEFGEIISVEAEMSCWRDGEFAEWLTGLDGGMMFYLGCHLIDLVMLLHGKPRSVHPYNKSTGIYGKGVKDNCFAVLEYDRGVSFVKTTAAERGGFLLRHLVVTGTLATVEVRPLEVSVGYPMQYTEYTEHTSTDWHTPGLAVRTPDYDRYEDMMLSFAAMVRGEITNPYTYDYELELYKTILKCCE